jgi:hypothetical protein
MELWCRFWGFYGRFVTHHNSMIGEAALVDEQSIRLARRC